MVEFSWWPKENRPPQSPLPATSSSSGSVPWSGGAPASVRAHSGFWGFVGRWLKRICMLIGGLFLFGGIAGCVAGFMMPNGDVPRKLPKEMVLTLKIEDLADASARGGFDDPFMPQQSLSLQDLVRAVHYAAEDSRVKGIVFGLPPASFDIAHVQELRTAIAAFRATGKFAKIYSANYGDYGDGLSRYYLASVFGEIWMQPVGTVALNGMSGEQPFLRKALESIGVRPEILQRKEYKTAFENFTHGAMTPANRDMTQSYMNNIMSSIVADIAADRKMSEAQVRMLIDKGVLTGPEALAAKLITRIDYGDQIVRETRKAILGREEAPLDADKDIFVSVQTYLDHPPKAPKHRPQVALIYVSGMIAPTAEGGLGGGEHLGADEVAGALLDVAEDPIFEGAVLRVDSPGGSPSASETIRNAVKQVRKKDKFVIVSMGPLAASGGYWLSANADTIYALPSTLTGSIGVVGGKADLSALWSKLGVVWEGPTIGANANMMSFNRPMDALAAERMNAMMDDIYTNFTRIVAEGRKMDPQAVEMIAKGRVWTGAQAKDIGLVDELGGLEAALLSAAKRTGGTRVDEIEVVQLPEPVPVFEQILQFFEQQTSVLSGLGHVMATLNTPMPSGALVYDPALDFLR